MAAELQWDYCPIWLSYSGTLVYASGLWYQRAVVWGQADFEFWQVLSECGHVDLPRHASLACPNTTQPLVCSGTTVLSGCHIWVLLSMLPGCGISEPLCGGS